MKSIAALLITIGLTTFQAQWTAAAVICGGDDFNDNVKNTNLWGADLHFAAGGDLVEASGRLEFSGTGAVVWPYVWSYRSYSQNWEVITDVGVGSVPLNQPDSHVQMFLAVVNRDDTNLMSGFQGDNFSIALDLYRSTGGQIERSFEAYFRTDWNELLPRGDAVTTSQQASFRVSFDAATKTLTAWYDANGNAGGYTWTALRSVQVNAAGSNWQMTSNSTFVVAVGASCDLFDVTSSDLVYADNFSVCDELVANATATGIFPIATNASVVEFGGGILFDGTNYMAGLMSGTNVSLQRFSANGALLGPLLNVGANPGFPPVVGFALGQTNCLVVWSDRSVSPGVDLFGQFVSRSGAQVGVPFNLLPSQGSHGFQTMKALASDGTNYLVVWQDETNRFFYGQMVSAAGTLSGSEFPISSQPQNGTSAAATVGQTNYLVVWQSKNGGQDYGTYGAFVSMSGVRGSPFQISQSTCPSHNPLAVAFDGANYLVVWNRNFLPGISVPDDWDFYGRLLSPAGTFPGNELGLVTDPGSQVLPSLAFDGSNYLLAWGDGSFNTTNATIRFRFFDRAAAPVGPSFTLFNAQGTNAPLSSYNCLLFDGSQFAVAATLGMFQRGTNGSINGLPSGDVYGAFIPKSTAPPRLDVAGPLVGAQFPLRLTGTPGINYTIQAITNLGLGNWTALVTNSPTNGTFGFTDTHATNASRFYRAVRQ